MIKILQDSTSRFSNQSRKQKLFRAISQFKIAQCHTTHDTTHQLIRIHLASGFTSWARVIQMAGNLWTSRAPSEPRSVVTVSLLFLQCCVFGKYKILNQSRSDLNFFRLQFYNCEDNRCLHIFFPQLGIYDLSLAHIHLYSFSHLFFDIEESNSSPSQEPISRM